MPPERLYKYQTVSERSVRAVASRTIWFSAPISSNDPLDCALQILTPELSDADVERLLDYQRKKHGITPELETRLAAEPGLRAEAKDGLLKTSLDAFTDARDSLLRERGVACFSECFDDILMWSHYGDGHRGFCLEFSTADQPFSAAHRVVYTTDMPAINIPDLLMADIGDEVREAMLLTKYSNWSYEKEWRVFSATANMAAIYSPDLLTGIYFGVAMSNEHKELVRRHVDGPSTKFYDMHVRERSFSLEARAAE